MKLQKVGFFRELPYGSPEEPSIHNSQKTLIEDEMEVLKYLQSGVLLAAAPGVEHDILDTSKIIIGSLNILTDGQWTWPESLCYYLRKYHVALPINFLEHIRNRNYVAPNPDQITLDDLEL